MDIDSVINFFMMQQATEILKYISIENMTEFIFYLPFIFIIYKIYKEVDRYTFLRLFYTEIMVEGIEERITISNNQSKIKVVYSNEYEAIQYYINNNINTKLNKINERKQIRTHMKNNYWDEETDRFMLISLNKSIILEQTDKYIIYGKTSKTQNNSDENVDIYLTTIYIYVIPFYHSYSFDEANKFIDSFIKKCIEDYDKYCHPDEDKHKLFQFDLKKIRKDEDSDFITEFKKEENTRKFELSNFYMKDKSQFYDQLLLFINGDISPEIIHLLGGKEKVENKIKTMKTILSKSCRRNKNVSIFSGSPGTGKTTLIEMVASVTKRHIVNINMKLVQNSEMFNAVLDKREFNGKKYDNHELCFVFEEMDTNSELFAQREEETKEKSIKTLSSDQSNNISSTINIPSFLKKEENGVGNILSSLDGLKKIDGLMILITTNYIDKLDKALLRPGRIDINCKLSYPSKDIVIQMIENTYETKIISKKQFINTEKIKDYCISPAMIQEILFKNVFEENRIQISIDDIIHLCQNTYESCKLDKLLIEDILMNKFNLSFSSFISMKNNTIFNEIQNGVLTRKNIDEIFKKNQTRTLEDTIQLLVTESSK